MAPDMSSSTTSRAWLAVRAAVLTVAVGTGLATTAPGAVPAGADAGPLSEAAAAGKAKTAAEWFDVVCRETERQRRTEPASWRQLLVGASIPMHPKKPSLTDLLAKEGKGGEEFAAFHRWWDGKGTALFDRWMQGGALTDNERPYRYILYGICFARYQKEVRPKEKQKASLGPPERAVTDRTQEVVRRGRDVLRQAYIEGQLTPGALDALRLYAMYTDVQCCGGKVLPFHLGIAASRPGHSLAGRRPKPGEPAPDFTLLTMEAALASPGYSDLNPYDPTAVLRPAILREYLLCIQGYERAPGRPSQPRVRARPVAVPQGREGDYVRLSSYRGRKAVLLVLANPTDAWCWHWSVAPMIEPLHRAYREHVAFLYVNTTIHDTYMTARDFFPPRPGRYDAVHNLTLCQRARTCKMFYMNWPHATVPYLLDDMAQRTRNAYRDQGGGAYFVLVDLDGRVAYADYHQDIPPHWGPKAVSFRDEFRLIRMNHLESRLAAFVEAGCRYDPKIETPYPPWRRGKKAGRSGQGRDDVPTIWLTGRVTAVHADQRVLEVAHGPPPTDDMKGLAFWRGAGDRAEAYLPDVKARLEVVRRWAARERPKTYRFAVDAGVDIFLNGRAAGLGDLKPGDRLGVQYPAASDAQDGIRPVHVRAYRLPAAGRDG